MVSGESWIGLLSEIAAAAFQPRNGFVWGGVWELTKLHLV
jgi:hypothetical protein